jgi:uncharacterized membrane protein
MYEVFLLGHIVGAIVWLGAGMLMSVQAFRAERAADDDALARIADDASQLSTVLFVPASLATLLFGIALVLDGPWGVTHLWVALGLAGYLATFLAGVLVMKPGSEKIAALIERDGGVSPDARVAIRKLLVKGRVDTVVLYLVVAVMALKPTGDDVALLAGMALVALGGVVFAALRLRAIDAEATGRPVAA